MWKAAFSNRPNKIIIRLPLGLRATIIRNLSCLKIKLDMDMSCRRKRTTDREDTGKFGIRYQTILERALYSRKN